MQMPILDSSAPAGVTITFRGKDVVINPVALSGKTIKALRRRLLDMRREEAKHLLSSRALSPAAQKQLIEASLDVGVTGFQAVMAAMQVPEVLAEFLAIGIGCDYDEANKLVEEYAPFDQLMLACVRAMGIDSLKNSSPPQTTGAIEEEANEAQPASHPAEL